GSTRRRALAPDFLFQNATLCLLLSLIAVHNKPRSVIIVSNNFGIWPTNRALKFAKLAAIAVVQIVWVSGTCAGETKYELKPISRPGATGAVALDYFAYDR